MVSRVAAIGFLLLLTACGTGGGQKASQGPVTVRLVEYAIHPKELTVRQGQTIEVVNAGHVEHNLYVDDGAGRTLARTEDMPPGARTSMTLRMPPGTYAMFCEVPEHEQMGMKGTLTVTSK